jgi:hypothetical protein
MINDADLSRMIGRRIKEEEFSQTPLIEIAMVAEPKRYGLLETYHIKSLNQAEEFKNKWIEYFDRLCQETFQSNEDIIKDLENASPQLPDLLPKDPCA